MKLTPFDSKVSFAMVSSDVQQKWKNRQRKWISVVFNCWKMRPGIGKENRLFLKVKAVVKSTAQLKWMRKKTTWNPKRSLRTSWCRSSARITWMFSVSTSFCLVLDKRCYPIALHWQIFNCCICFSFGVIGHIFTLVLMLFCCVFALLLTAFWVLLPFFVTLQILRFANLGKDTSGTRLSTCNNPLRRVQKLFAIWSF